MFFQLVEDNDALNETLAAVDALFANSSILKPLPNPRLGDTGIAIYADDGLPYRCRLLTDPKSIAKGAVVDIAFIDFGNTSSDVAVEGIFAIPECDKNGTDLRPLLSPHRAPGFALGPFKLAGLGITPSVAEAIVDTLTEDVIYLAELKDDQSRCISLLNAHGHPLIDLPSESTRSLPTASEIIPNPETSAPSITPQPIQSSTRSITPPASLNTPSAESTTLKIPPILLNWTGKLPVGVTKPFDYSAGLSPSCFFASLKENEKESEAMEDLMGEAGAFPPLREVEVGDFCVGKFSEDNFWYRAEVLEIREEAGSKMAQLRFIDYGNEEEMPMTQDRVRSMPTPLDEIPPLVFQCCLDGVKPVGRAWKEEAVDVLVDLFEESPELQLRCSSTKRTANGPIHRVDIIVDGQPLAAVKALIAKGFAVSA